MQLRHSLAPFLLRAPELRQIGLRYLFILHNCGPHDALAHAQGISALSGRRLVRDTDQSLVRRQILHHARASREVGACRFVTPEPRRTLNPHHVQRYLPARR